ncbi:DUF1549 and DUF1553 domain-containing protein [Tuwongella immobilis]|uniref:S-layer protein n=1 Tax=Tuwongella immobilis TaxID=692036 RepID=A0A6C2YS72_9BACT|nr:DUF1549 and DUF1553 domain-containing protein [Tuwongella immobilis]VIP04211.1 Uncharacterized protein OS=Singulisphaera acidiphila (strain ATCC BAA-1392 / DSM 18658 / VKM B-2454 / MOB10) GN=Sinac_2821 PE=4 SV=1: PSCyt2: PSD1 [Tuwongella immobilis]VTS05786.1 Uncharacterized protein OS=Singulisphaera acidiphila (strain ATCC BAA-1392 / DSM 18658 / VKM B-2454 / MOB10) GN=Sinac_2821 PE=4 SV=1: PSCyt2: PSD1 [Tuwongella immobilis]
MRWTCLFASLCLATTLHAEPIPDRPIDFVNEIQPILTRGGCNSGPCHGKARGQNGFQLSLLAFDHEADYAALTAEARGRRIFPAAPEQSLLIRKATAEMPHGGGRKLTPGDGMTETLVQWIRQGMPKSAPNAPKLSRIQVEPTSVKLGYRGQQSLKVTALYSDGSTRDVTKLANFSSNESTIAAVTEHGQINAGPLPGEAAIMARFMDQFALCQVVIPYPGTVDPKVYDQWPKTHFIDKLVADKWQQLNLTPSALAEEPIIVQRLYLDLIGRLPTPDEVRTYLADATPNKRERLIDDLLSRPEYADFWANKWADLLRPNPYHVGLKTVFNFDGWIRQAFRENRPYDQFVRDLVASTGTTWRNGATVIYRDRRDPAELTTIISQLFLGIRLDCAKCHHHPFEVYGQEEFYSFAAYFERIGRKGVGISAPISGSEEMVFHSSRPINPVSHPLTGKRMTAKPLFGEAAPDSPDVDPRQTLANWITSPKNPYFAKVMVNRVWADLMGRGIVEPVDDLRATNPPTNGPLLDALADDFRANGYDIKKLLKTIVQSRVYQLSTAPNAGNAGDLRNYSRYYRQRLRAEVLLDAICDVTGVPESFDAMPPGSRSMQLWTHRSSSLFLDSFGRPDPNQDPPCERTGDTSVVQALHLMNAPNLHAKVTSERGTVAKLVAEKKSDADTLRELFLLTFSRLPTPAEESACLKLFADPSRTRRQVIEDLLWAMINAPEFQFKN